MFDLYFHLRLFFLVIIEKTVIGEIGIIARLTKTETKPTLILTALPPE